MANKTRWNYYLSAVQDINLKELLEEIFYFNIEDVDSYLEGQVIMITGGGVLLVQSFVGR